MAHQILVIEYEPRYIQRIEEAAARSGLSTTVARTGDEAIQALPRQKYDLIVLSTIIPRYSTAQLIRSIRNDGNNASTPVLLTTSGYSGTDPRSDAVKLGASDMLVKPYAPPDFVQKVSHLLNLPGPAAAPDEAETTLRLSTEQIFGDLLDDTGAGRTVEQARPDAPQETVPIPKAIPLGSGEVEKKTVEKKKRSAVDDVDQMLADTLAGVRATGSTRKRRTTASEDIDKLLETTLSGLETPRPKDLTPAPQPEPEPEPVAEEPPPPPPAPTEKAASEEPPASPEQLEEEDPFPEVAAAAPEPEPEPEPDEPPFEGVEERDSGTTLIRDEPAESDQPEAEEVEEEADTTRFGQYVLLEKIATGGMAEVWKARMRGLEGFEKIVAIKKILPHLSDNAEFIEMFVDEAKLAAQLSHNNIIHIYDLGKIDQSWFIAMEYIDGYDLKSLLARGKQVGRPLPIPLALFVASRVAAALDYAHRKKGFDDQELGLVHRDVSPQNVLISRDGDIKLCDFGIAKAATKASHTQAGALKGKLQYMSPEQAWGRHIDHRSDIFATAAVLFEMLAGRKLFSGDSELSVLDQVREAQVPAPSVYNREVPSEIDDVVLKALEKEPGARYQTAGEMARAIDSILYNYKPAPTPADLTLYVAAIDEPDLHPMPAIPEVKPAPRVEVPPPVPVPEEAAPTEITPIQQLRPPTPSEGRIEESGSTAAGEDPFSPGLESEDAAVAAAPFSSGREDEPRKSKAVPIAIAAVLLLAALGAGAFMMFGGSGDQSSPQEQTAAVTPSSSPVGESGEGVPDQAATMVSEGVTPDALAAEQLTETETGLGADDLALIDQAVRQRIDAERRRLEQQAPAQTPAQPQAPPRQTTEQTRPQQATPTTTPPPQETPTPSESRPAPAEEPPARPAQQPPATEAPARTEPAPAPAKPAVRRGDMVEPGTPGLTDPQIVSLKKVGYPPLARRNRVEGLVIIRALISEDGKVLETQLLRGVSQNVGLNEAALEMVKGGQFTAGKLENVAVRAWKTIPIPFKME